MRAWYDVFNQDMSFREDEAGVRRSQQEIEKLITKEKDRGIGASRIVLAGFSQGGAIALQTGLRYSERLAGIMALSSYLPLASTLATEANAANHAVPIFMAHGTADPLIPLPLASLSREHLKQQGYQVEWHQYLMPHSVCQEEIRDIGQWLQHVLT
jgi:phospholipase/carboxylesterase